MSRLDQRNVVSRVDLGRSIDTSSPVGLGQRRPLLKPLAAFYAGVLGFVCCGAAVVVTASLIALQIQ